MDKKSLENYDKAFQEAKEESPLTKQDFQKARDTNIYDVVSFFGYSVASCPFCGKSASTGDNCFSINKDDNRYSCFRKTCPGSTENGSTIDFIMGVHNTDKF